MKHLLQQASGTGNDWMETRELSGLRCSVAVPCSQLPWFAYMTIESPEFILSSQIINSFREEIGTRFGSTWDKIQEVIHVW